MASEGSQGTQLCDIPLGTQQPATFTPENSKIKPPGHVVIPSTESPRSPGEKRRRETVTSQREERREKAGGQAKACAEKAHQLHYAGREIVVQAELEPIFLVSVCPGTTKCTNSGIWLLSNMSLSYYFISLALISL